MAKDLTPYILTYSASLRNILDTLIYEYADRVAMALMYRRSWYGSTSDPLARTHRAFGDYISINGEGELTYLPTARIETALDTGIEWNKKLRQAGRPAKVARALLTPETLKTLTDSDFEKFTNHLRARVLKDRQSVRIVEGESIRHWYDGNHYAPRGTGTLRTSCMRYDECQPYMDFYVNNPDAVKMVIATDQNDLLIGRALLWNTVEQGWAMDRAYGNDTVVHMLRDWAAEQGYIIRHANSFERETLWDVPGELGKQLFLSVDLLTGSSRGYPYCDTFKYLFIDEDAGTIRVKNHQRGAPATYELTSTNGYPFIQTCSECGAESNRNHLQDGMCYDCRMQHVCTACEHRRRGHGPEGQLCSLCADDYRCRNCNDYLYERNRNRLIFSYPSYYRNGEALPVCRTCYETWLCDQTCAICHNAVTMTNALQVLMDTHRSERTTVCAGCFDLYSCQRCSRIDTENMQTLRFNVDHSYRPEYTERMCSECQGLRCSYCGDIARLTDRFTQHGDTFECPACQSRRQAVARRAERARLRREASETGDNDPSPSAPTITFRLAPSALLNRQPYDSYMLQHREPLVVHTDVEDELDLPF